MHTGTYFSRLFCESPRFHLGHVSTADYILTGQYIRIDNSTISRDICLSFLSLRSLFNSSFFFHFVVCFAVNRPCWKTFRTLGALCWWFPANVKNAEKLSFSSIVLSFSSLSLSLRTLSQSFSNVRNFVPLILHALYRNNSQWSFMRISKFIPSLHKALLTFHPAKNKKGLSLLWWNGTRKQWPASFATRSTINNSVSAARARECFTKSGQPGPRPRKVVGTFVTEYAKSLWTLQREFFPR